MAKSLSRASLSVLLSWDTSENQCVESSDETPPLALTLLYRRMLDTLENHE
jgi:hypothetical protein